MAKKDKRKNVKQMSIKELRQELPNSTGNRRAQIVNEIAKRVNNGSAKKLLVNGNRCSRM